MDSVEIHGYGDTDIGQNRMVNEDYFDINESLYVLADGMGGHNAGEVASRLAVEHLFEFLKKLNYLKETEHINERQIQKNIIEGIKQTNQLIYQSSNQKTEWKGMGTTIVLALFQKPNIIHVANVGDSRAYLIRDEKLKKITEDHSITASMLRDGTITKNEAETHPYRHHLIQSIGTSNTVKPYITYFQIMPEDKILLCSDGLWDVLSKKEMNKIIQTCHDPKKICKALIKKAKNKQSTDNISCLMITSSKKVNVE